VGTTEQTSVESCFKKEFTEIKVCEKCDLLCVVFILMMMMIMMMMMMMMMNSQCFSSYSPLSCILLAVQKLCCCGA
jgi:hypothetical protein